jgi:hypothetical protein
MAERKAFGVGVARFFSRTRRKRETFKIAMKIPRRRSETESDPTEQALDNATKIFGNLVESGRLTTKKK